MTSNNTTNNTTSGFSVVELLVVIGIIALLMAILLPALSKARTQAQLVQDLSNIRQVGLALLSYSTNNRGQMLPAEQFGNATQLAVQRSANFVLDPSWTELTTSYKIPASSFGCNTLNNIQAEWPLFGLYQTNWQGYGCSIIGWNYFGGRNPGRSYLLSPTSTPPYPFNVIQSYTDKLCTSQALLTCMNYDAADPGKPWESISPHYNGACLYIASGLKWKPMNGLNCAFLDGHASWVPYSKMIVFINPAGDFSFVPGPGAGQ